MPHFTDGGTEAQREKLTCPSHRARRWWNWDYSQGHLVLPKSLLVTTLLYRDQTCHSGWGELMKDARHMPTVLRYWQKLSARGGHPYLPQLPKCKVLYRPPSMWLFEVDQICCCWNLLMLHGALSRGTCPSLHKEHISEVLHAVNILWSLS